MSTRVRLRQGLTIRELPDGDAVVAAATGEQAVIVNAAAHAVLDLLGGGGGATQPEIVDELCRAFPQARADDVRRDVAALLAELERNGLVEPCGAGPSTA